MKASNENFVNLNGKDEIQKIVELLDYLFLDGEVIELRALGVKFRSYEHPAKSMSAYYKKGDPVWGFLELACAAVTYSEGNKDIEKSSGVYFCVNPCLDAAFQRGHKLAKDVTASKDDEMPTRRILYVDCDPVRTERGLAIQGSIPSSDAEHDHAIKKAEETAEFLTREFGFPAPVMFDSGNGCSLFYVCDIPANAETDKAFKEFLVSLGSHLTDKNVKIDQTVYNRSRIVRLAETWNRKAESSVERPHRQAKLMKLPGERVEVTLEQIQSVVDSKKKREVAPAAKSDDTPARSEWTGATCTEEQFRELLDDFFTKFNERHADDDDFEPIEIMKEKDDGTKLILGLNRCPWNQTHKDNDAAFFFDHCGDNAGMKGFGCFHDSCNTKTWADARELMKGYGVSFEEKLPDDDAIAAAVCRPAVQVSSNPYDQVPSPEPRSQADAEPDNKPDEDGDALRDLGIEITKIESKGGTKYFRVAKCPCCQKRGAFWRSEKATYGYNCAAKQRSWKDGERLWTADKEGDPEVLQEKYGEDMLNWFQLQQLAESMPSEFIAQGWLHEGHLSIFAGREKRGKSTAIYDLITAILTGQQWMGRVDTKLVPVILLDYENPANYIFESMRRMVARRQYLADGKIDESVFNSHFAVLHPDLIRKHCSPVNMSEIVWRIEKMKERSGCNTGLFVIDTASPAFQGLFEDPNWTNSGPQVRQAMEIVQQVARQTGWHVMVVYHQNKSGGGASGSYEWQATADVFITFERDDLTKPEGVISINGRLVNPPAPMKFRLSDGLLQAYDDSPESQQAPDPELTDGEKMDYAIFMSEMPASREEAENQQAIIKKFAGRIGKNKVLRFLSTAVERRELGSSPGNPKFYWKLDQDTVDFVSAIRDDS